MPDYPDFPNVILKMSMLSLFAIIYLYTQAFSKYMAEKPFLSSELRRTSWRPSERADWGDPSLTPRSCVDECAISVALQSPEREAKNPSDDVHVSGDGFEISVSHISNITEMQGTDCIAFSGQPYGARFPGVHGCHGNCRLSTSCAKLLPA